MSPSILYSFRRCPYAMRARLAIKKSGLKIELREITLKNKPPEMLEVAPVGTVPVLLERDKVYTESLDIMLWALEQNDPDQWLSCDQVKLIEMLDFITDYDQHFKPILDRYKYFERFPEHPKEHYLQQALPYLEALEQRLSQHDHLFSQQAMLVDFALMPFIRQFAGVEIGQLERCNLLALHAWLQNHCQSPLFQSIMLKHTQWQLRTDETAIIYV